MKGVTVITHPLVQHNLTRLRDLRTQPQEFRRVLSEVAALMLYEATRSFGVRPVSVKTPLAAARGFRLLYPQLGDVALEAAMAQPTEQPRRPFPLHLLEVPGLIGDMVSYYLSSSPRRQPALPPPFRANCRIS